MSQLAEYIASTRSVLREANSEIYDSGEDSYESFVRRALRRYSIDKPFIKVSAITGASSIYITVNETNLPGYIYHWSVIEGIEVKAPTVASNEVPCFIERDEWDLYRNSTALYIWLKNAKPPSSYTISVTYTIPHTINKLDSETVDTIPSLDFEAIVLWTAREASLMLAAKNSGTSDPTVRSDIVNYKTKSSEFRALSDKFKEAYQAWIHEPLKAAGLIRDLDFGFSHADNSAFLTHRSGSRN